jgi:hypothetical protein
VNTKAFEPKDVTTPIQLIAAWLLALLSFAALFLKAAHDIEDPGWAPNLLVLSAVGVIAVGSGLVFLLLTLFRPQTLSDEAYVLLRANEQRFKDFEPDSTQSEAAPALAAAGGAVPLRPEAETLEQLRDAEYERTARLFLTHGWRPSMFGDQKADISIRLHQHRQGPLTTGEVERVEYELGRKFFPEPVVKLDPSDGFRLDVSAYAPFLCLARVYFKDGREPVDLYRYLDFPEGVSGVKAA